jgi:hypothetical protein
MNGRVYDYQLGRFLSVDPHIDAPLNSQSLNPYSYIMNNPLSGTDPTGYDDDPTIGTHIPGVEAVGTETSATGSHLPSASAFGNELAGNGKVGQGTTGAGSRQDQAAGESDKESAAVTGVKPDSGLHYVNNGDPITTTGSGSAKQTDFPDLMPDAQKDQAIADAAQNVAATTGEVLDTAAMEAAKTAPLMAVPEIGILGRIGRWLGLVRDEEIATDTTAVATKTAVRRETPNLSVGAPGVMFKQARSQIVAMSGTAEDKAMEFERLAAQIESHSGGSWGMGPRFVGTDGSISYVGKGADYMITIANDGRVFSGTFSKGMARSGGQFSPIYDNLREVK